MTNSRAKSRTDRESSARRIAWIALLALLASTGPSALAQDTTQWRESVERAIAYLAVEVEKWRPDNGCFSCHNNGDGARALYLARSLGFDVPEKALAETTEWLRQPQSWDTNPGDPAVSDKKLARLQFSAALAAAIQPDTSSGKAILDEALRSVLADQTESGFWRVDAAPETGSPVTWGNPLATLYTIGMLTSLDENEPNDKPRLAARKGLDWLTSAEAKTTIGKAVLISALAAELTDIGNRNAVNHETLSITAARTCESLLSQQGSDGGWGPYAATPSEVFDTAVVVLNLVSCVLPADSKQSDDVARGRALQFLIRTQTPAGGWPETTRPPGGQSYAQHISTTAWALMALLTEAARSI